MDERFSLVLAVPRVAQIFNRLLDPHAERLVDLSGEAMRKRAAFEAGYSSFGDDSFIERMDIACEALSSQANFSALGRLAVGVYYHFHTVNHLRVRKALEEHPEIEDVPVEAPLFIIGWYRTGTTQLHNILATDPRHRAPLTYELLTPQTLHPDPRWDRRLRIARANFLLQLSRYLVPETEAAHYVPVDAPEECFFLLENDWVSSTLFNTYQAYGYGEWLLTQDLTPSYRFLKQQLQLLSYRKPRQRWVLKSPFHLWHLDALRNVFPDARIVFTHRDVTEALPSNCSLSAMTTSKFARELDREALVSFWRRYYREGLDRAFASREKLPQGSYVDVPLEWLARRPMEALETIYDELDLAWNDEVRACFENAIAANPRQTKGKHRYTPEQFGLEAAQLEREFESYQAFLARLRARRGLLGRAAAETGEPSVDATRSTGTASG